MADEATTEDEQQDATAQTETTAEEPQEGAEQVSTDDGDQFDPSKALDKIRKLNSEAANLRKRVKEAEGKAADTGEKDSRIKALEAENLRIRIGARHGLPDTLIDRLKGDTEEEILADAEKLLELVAPAKRPPTVRPTERTRSTTETVADTEETDISKLGARMFRR
jgi:hypothetical protein